MNRLVHAGIYRLIRNRAYIGCTLFTLLYCSGLYVLQYWHMKDIGEHYSFEPLLFNFLIIQGIVTAIFMSLLVGAEFSEGTVRNKLIAGYKKSEIYLAQLITCILAEVGMILAVYIVCTILGFILFGPIEMPLGQFLMMEVIGIFAGITYTAIFNVVIMICANKANGAIVCILLAVGIIFVSIMLYSRLGAPEFIEEAVSGAGKIKNTAYIEGGKRTIYQVILDLLPNGQIMQMMNVGEINGVRLIVSSILESAVLTGIGTYLFKGKDIN